MGCQMCAKNPDENDLESFTGTDGDSFRKTPKKKGKEEKKQLLDEFIRNLQDFGEKISVDEFNRIIGEKLANEYKTRPYENTTCYTESNLLEPGPIKMKNGIYYYGTWNTKGAMEGQGQFYSDKDGSNIYVDGVWKNGNLEKGKVIQEGNVYNGDIANGLYNGQGEIHYSDGSVYKGSFVDGKKQGEGNFVFPDGTKFSGMFLNDELGDIGRIDWPNGIIYEGEMENGIFHGEGNLIWPNKSKYKGQFKNGVYHGNGKFVWILDPERGTVESYEGFYFDGKKTGLGVYTFEDKSKVEGEFNENVLNGDCVYYKDGYKYSNEFANGEEINEMIVEQVEGEDRLEEPLEALPEFDFREENIDIASLPHINTSVIKKLYRIPNKEDAEEKDLDGYKFSVVRNQIS